MEASAEDNMQQLSEFDQARSKTWADLEKRSRTGGMDLNGRNGRDASNLCDRIKRD
jgi:hypothetical protein